MISGILITAAAVWWAASMAVLLLSFAAVLLRPVREVRQAPAGNLPPLTAIVPVSTWHPAFEEAQRSLLGQHYPGLEVLLVSTDLGTPAIAAAAKLIGEYPGANARIIKSDCTGAVSPKLNNIWPAIRAAREDLVLTKDSNLTLVQGELESLVRHLAPDTGLVSTISIATTPESLAAWIEASIINCYHARVLMLAAAMGFGFGLGKIMLFRRSDVMRAGGFESLAWALGEDMALAQAVQGLGLRTVLAGPASRQSLGARPFSEFWRRQLRWMIIWRTQLPAAFLGDLLGSALPTALAGAIAATLLGVSPLAVFCGTLLLWFAIESVLCVAQRWPLSLWSPIAFVCRELLTPVLWLCACTTDRVIWAGQPCRAGRNPKREAVDRHNNIHQRAQRCDR